MTRLSLSLVFLLVACAGSDPAPVLDDRIDPAVIERVPVAVEMGDPVIRSTIPEIVEDAPQPQ